MRIASWNVNSVRTRLEQVLAWLQQERPDVLCLQETKVTDELFPREAFEALGYAVAISGQKAYNGVAILSLLPLEDVQIGFEALLPAEQEAAGLSEQKRVISALIEGVRVLNLYVPNGGDLTSDKYPYKLGWLDTLAGRLRPMAEGALVVCGDFNDTPNSYVYALISEGLADTFRKKGMGVGTTFAGALPMLRIDYILTEQSLATYSCRVVRKEISDHYLVLAAIGAEQPSQR